MASNFVNLDAIIPREDWDATPDQPTRDMQSQAPITFKCVEFESTGLAFKFLRKPEFQRETASWDPKKVADLVKCFLEGELIPSIIIWKNEQSKYLFVIDGAHRLGALIAWVHDDYGNGALSNAFFKGKISPEQKAAHDLTRELIEKSVGSYQKIKNWDVRNPSKESKYAYTLVARSVVVQEIGGGSKKAEDSFFRINQQAAPITPTELELIRSRKKAYGIATRAIVRAGVGHKFWNEFPVAMHPKIEAVAAEIHSLLFEPPLSEPIRIGLDLPIGGRGYSTEAISLALGFVNLTISAPKKKEKRRGKAEEKPEPPDDVSGQETLGLLGEVKKLTRRMAGNVFPSLGLHSAVYFYSATGRFQPTAFLATASLIRELEAGPGNRFLWFTRHRAKFERFLVGHRFLINQMVLKHGSMEKSHEPMLELYRTALQLASEDKDDKEIMSVITEKFPYLRQQEAKDFASQSADASRGNKNAAARKLGMGKAHCCTICTAAIHPNAVSWDHTLDKKHGGTGSAENLQPTHPFCNMCKDELIPLFST